jgi:hypothetical protein
MLRSLRADPRWQPFVEQTGLATWMRLKSP